MSVNNVSSATANEVYNNYGSSAATGRKSSTAEKSSSKADNGVVYEKSTEQDTRNASYSITKMSAEDRAALVQQLKADQESRQQNLIGIVQQMIGKQANTSNLASLFSAENLKNVDAAAIAQAKEDVSENGYWGVTQTSQRLFDFACALAGDDVDKLKEMQEAMMKGYKQATKAWGTDLPSICQQTIDAANQLFEDYYNSKE